MTSWEGKKVLVTGGARFLGSHIVKQLFSTGVHPENLNLPRSMEHCLLTSRAKGGFGFEAKVSLDEGLKRTIERYLNRP